MKIKSGEPCGHHGCLSHVTKPCEGCGRINGQGAYESVSSGATGDTPQARKGRLYFGKVRKDFTKRGTSEKSISSN